MWEEIIRIYNTPRVSNNYPKNTRKMEDFWKVEGYGPIPPPLLLPAPMILLNVFNKL